MMCATDDGSIRGFTVRKHHHHHQHKGLDPLIRSVSRVTICSRQRYVSISDEANVKLLEHVGEHY
jgi:hypothetical protein